MIDCPNGEVRDLLPDLLHDRLPLPQRREVERHVASCDPCSAELALLRDFRATLSRVPVIDTRAIAAAIPPYRAAAKKSWVGWRTAAAIAMIALGGTSVAIVNHQRSGPDVTHAIVQPPVATQQIPTHDPSTPPGGALANAESTARAAESLPGRASSSPVDPGSRGSGEGEQLIAMAGGTVNELSDRELSTLLREIETLDALPSADVETASSILPAISTDGAP
jgi:hypothetical protein